MRYALTDLYALVFKRLNTSRIWLSLAGIEGCTCFIIRCIVLNRLTCPTYVQREKALRAENKENLAHKCKNYFFPRSYLALSSSDIIPVGFLHKELQIIKWMWWENSLRNADCFVDRWLLTSFLTLKIYFWHRSGQNREVGLYFYFDARYSSKMANT